MPLIFFPSLCSETCNLEVLAGLPRLQEVTAAGYGEYTTEGLPPSVRHLSLQVRSEEQWVASALLLAAACPPTSHCCGV